MYHLHEKQFEKNVYIQFISREEIATRHFLFFLSRVLQAQAKWQAEENCKLCLCQRYNKFFLRNTYDSMREPVWILQALFYAS